jgi:hypothetical protein
MLAQSCADRAVLGASFICGDAAADGSPQSHVDEAELRPIPHSIVPLVQLLVLGWAATSPWCRRTISLTRNRPGCMSVQIVG